MAYHVGIFKGSDVYGERYDERQMVVIWQSDEGAVVDAGGSGVVLGGTQMKIFGSSVIDTESVFGREAIAKASPDELLAMVDAATDRAYQVARQRALRNISFWARYRLGRKFDSIWRGQNL